MNDWIPGTITAYWEHRTGAIHAHSEKLAGLGKADREAALLAIEGGVRRHVDALDDNELHRAALCMIEDLYKSVSTDFIMRQPLLDYLEASAGMLCRLLHVRGYVIHYVVDNTFPSDAAGMQGPLVAFPEIFGAAGFVYICPQHAAVAVMERDGVVRQRRLAEMPIYIGEGRSVADMVLGQCHENGDHYFFLDTDSSPGSFTAPLAAAKNPGVINIFREESPVEGSKVKVIYPKTRSV